MFAGAEVAPIGSRKHASRLPAYYWRRPLTFELALQGVRRQERKGNKAGEAGMGLGQAIYG